MKKENVFQAYSEEMLEACRNGKPCSYGICDECPNTLRDIRGDEDDESNEDEEDKSNENARTSKGN